MARMTTCYLKVPLSFMKSDAATRERFLKDILETAQIPTWAISDEDLKRAEILDCEPEEY